MNIPQLCVRMALIYATIAMLLGLHMAAAQDYSWSAAHAHLAIIGWFGLISTGFLFRNFPQLTARCGKAVAGGLILGVPLMALGLLGAGAGWAQPLTLLGGVLLTAAVALLAYCAVSRPLA